MTEVVNCGGGHRTRLRDVCCVFGVPPASVYKGGVEEAGPLGARQVWGVLLGLPSLSRIPLSSCFSFSGVAKGEREEE